MRLLAILLTGLMAGVLTADPVPRSEYDRKLVVAVKPLVNNAVEVLYHVEFDDQTLVMLVGDPNNGFPLDFSKTQNRQQFANAFVSRMKVVIPDSVVGTLDGRPIVWSVESTEVEFVDSVRFRFRLRGDRGIDAGRHSLEIEDLNFAEKKGKFAIEWAFDPALKIEKQKVPPDRPAKGLDDPERRTANCMVTLESTVQAASEAPNVEPKPDEESPGFWSLYRLVREHGLKELFRSDIGIWVILILAFLHGAMHSLAPGHGKTMVAAYLVGEQGTPRHAVILGMIVTLTHTSTAFAVALLLKFVFTETSAETVQKTLGFFGGLTVAFVGFWLLAARLQGDSHDHGHGHSHSHADGGHGHSHGMTPEDFRKLSWTRLILLGISGGVVPCWGAILWVLYCVSAGRFGLALSAVVAFSLGLASILVLMGLAVVWSTRYGNRRFGSSPRFLRFAKLLPILGAVTVMAIGLWLCADSLRDPH